jgi:AraC-like DNA-binding protein
MLKVKRWPISPSIARHLGEILHVSGSSGPPNDYILPDVNAADIAIHLGDPGQLLVGDGSIVQQRRLVVGGLSRAVQFRHGAVIDTVFIALPPSCACLLGLPAAALRDVVAPLEVIAPALDASLHSWTDAYREGRAAASELNQILGATLRLRCDRVVREIAKTLSDPSAPTVASLATAFELSRRQLDRRFGDAMGRSPREFRRFARFARAWRLAGEGRVESWADLAAHAGYFDQAHLNHDFRCLTGATPRVVFPEAWYAAFDRTAFVGS